jgi:type IV pilus assembly protein PilC
MRLQYQAKDRNGAVVAGELEAESIAEGRAQLRRQGLFLMSLKSAADEHHSGPSRPSNSRGRVRSSELAMWMSQLTIMCQSGVALADALQHSAESTNAAGLREVVQSLYIDVSSGSSFSQALRKHPQVFQDTFVAGIAAGEQTGNIVQVLERLSTLLRNERRLRSSIWTMLTYPMFLCGVMAAVLIGLVFFVLPQFGKVFAGFGHPAPPITQILLDVADFARANIVVLMCMAIALVIGAAYVAKRPVSRRIWDHMLMNAIVVRSATRTLTSGRSFYLLGTMLQSGVPLLECLRLCRSASKSLLFRSLFDRMEQDLLRGQGISNSLISANFLPAGAAQMIATAERNGRLGQVLVTVGEHYEEEGENSVRNIVKIAEPALIVVLGVVVATVVMSVMLPLFDASTMAQ